MCSIKKSPDGYQAKAGDVTYYAPWGDVVVEKDEISN